MLVIVSRTQTVLDGSALLRCRCRSWVPLRNALSVEWFRRVWTLVRRMSCQALSLTSLSEQRHSRGSELAYGEMG